MAAKGRFLFIIAQYYMRYFSFVISQMTTSSESGSSCDESVGRRRLRMGVRMGVRYSSDSGHDYSSSSEQSCDTVIYVGRRSQSLSESTTDTDTPEKLGLTIPPPMSRCLLTEKVDEIRKPPPPPPSMGVKNSPRKSALKAACRNAMRKANVSSNPTSKECWVDGPPCLQPLPVPTAYSPHHYISYPDPPQGTYVPPPIGRYLDTSTHDKKPNEQWVDGPTEFCVGSQKSTARPSRMWTEMLPSRSQSERRPPTSAEVVAAPTSNRTRSESPRITRPTKPAPPPRGVSKLTTTDVKLDESLNTTTESSEPTTTRESVYEADADERLECVQEDATWRINCTSHNSSFHVPTDGDDKAVVRPICLRRPDGASNPNLHMHADEMVRDNVEATKDIADDVDKKTPNRQSKLPTSKKDKSKKEKESKSVASPSPKLSAKSRFGAFISSKKSSSTSSTPIPSKKTSKLPITSPKKNNSPTKSASSSTSSKSTRSCSKSPSPVKKEKKLSGPSIASPYATVTEPTVNAQRHSKTDMSSGYESMLRDSTNTSSSSAHADSTSESSAGGVTAGFELKAYNSKDVERLQCRTIKDDGVRARRARIRRLLNKQATLKDELRSAKEALMIDPSTWSYDLYVAEQMDRDDPHYVQALENETAILEKRVAACKSRIMVVTVFDTSGSPPVTTVQSTNRHRMFIGAESSV